MTDLPDNITLPTNDIKDMLVCPLSRMIFLDPVMASDGIIYERQMIEKWLADNDTSPITRGAMGRTLTPIISIKQLVSKLLEDNEDLQQEQFEPEYNLHDLWIMQKDFSLESLKKLKSFPALEIMAIYDKYCDGVSLENCFTNEIFRNFEKMKYIIDHCDDLESIDEWGWQLIHCIALTSTDQILNYIIDKNVDIHIITNLSRTVFQLAMGNSRIHRQTLLNLRINYSIKQIRQTYMAIAGKLNFDEIEFIANRADMLINYVPDMYVKKIFKTLIVNKYYDEICKLIKIYPKKSLNNIDILFNINDNITNAFIELLINDPYKQYVTKINTMQIDISNLSYGTIKQIYKYELNITDKFKLDFLRNCIDNDADYLLDFLNDEQSFIKKNYAEIIFPIIKTRNNDIILKYLYFAQLNGIKLETIYKCGRNLLHAAVNKNLVGVVEYLLQTTKINIHECTDKGNNVISLAIFKCFDLELIHKFVNLGVNYSKPNKIGSQAIHIAAELGRLDVIHYLLALGVDINVWESRSKFIALHRAAKYGTLETVKELIKLGADEYMLTSKGLKYNYYFNQNKNININILIENYLKS
jgi:ankyrin repeat protein